MCELQMCECANLAMHQMVTHSHIPTHLPIPQSYQAVTRRDKEYNFILWVRAWSAQFHLVLYRHGQAESARGVLMIIFPSDGMLYAVLLQ
jgi:hypothetical protein